MKFIGSARVLRESEALGEKCCPAERHPGGLTGTLPGAYLSWPSIIETPATYNHLRSA
ncbi:MAG TPA: hypothetical protein VK864_05005 [Longimicrobiales bacterium]|nr:hypothetical protein [Longimicrobiales bacterium]